jgi:hypothetical protein
MARVHAEERVERARAECDRQKGHDAYYAPPVLVIPPSTQDSQARNDADSLIYGAAYVFFHTFNLMLNAHFVL